LLAEKEKRRKNCVLESTEAICRFKEIGIEKNQEDLQYGT